MPRPVTVDEVPLCPSISLARALRTFQQQDILCDLTLFSEDHKRVRVHKAVFAAMSGYLSKRLKNKQPCDKFILTGISVEAIKGLSEFVYGNVYAVNVKNADEIYPIAVLFEFALLQKLCEYLNPKVTELDWTNKIIPVSPNLLAKKPTGPKPASKKSEEINKASVESAEEQSSEEETTPQATKAKRPALKSPSLKEPLSKKQKKNETDEENDDKPKDDDQNTRNTKEDNQNKEKRSSGDKDTDNIEKDPKLKVKVEIKLKRVDPEKYESPQKSTGRSTSPQKSKLSQRNSNLKEDVKSKKIDDQTEVAMDDSDVESDVETTKRSKKAVSKPGDQNEKEDNPEKESASEVKTPKRKSRAASKTVEQDGNEKNTENEEIETPPKDKTPKRKTKSASMNCDEKENEGNEVFIVDDEPAELTTESPKRKSESSPTKKSGRKSHPQEETVFECGKCKALFTNLEKCNSHMAKDHRISMVSVDKNYICSREDCGFKCDAAGELKNHVLQEHPESMILKSTCGICDAEFESPEELEKHVGAAHKKGKAKEKAINIKGKNNNDEPEVNKSTGELKVTNRPGPKSSKPDKPGPKSSKLKQARLSGNLQVTSSPPLRTETKIVNGEKLKVTSGTSVKYLDERTVRVEDDSMLEGWAKLLVARKDLTKYDFYVQSADGRKHRSMKELHDYLDKKQIEMETEHISFKVTDLLHQAGIDPLSKGTTPRRRSRPGPKSSKKKNHNESSDMEVDDDSDAKINKSIEVDDEDEEEDEDESNPKKNSMDVDDLEHDKDECDSNGSTHKVDVHIY